MWSSLVEALGSVLAFFYGIIPNYGIAIILLTVTVRVVLFPLTAKQARAQAKMQAIQPELKKIQAKYKGNKQKLNEEMMKLYRENRVNPLGGCLPLLLQMPIFIALYQVLRSPHTRVPTSSKLFAALCGDAAANSCKPRGLGFLGMDLGKSLQGVWGDLIAAIPYAILVTAVVLVGILQGKQTQGASTGQANPQAKMMSRVFPLLFGFISLSLPAGIVLYFLVSSSWQVAQQQVVTRKLVPSAAPLISRTETAGAAGAALDRVRGHRHDHDQNPPSKAGPGRPAAKQPPRGGANTGSSARKPRPGPQPRDGQGRSAGAPSDDQGVGAKPRGKKRRT